MAFSWQRSKSYGSLGTPRNGPAVKSNIDSGKKNPSESAVDHIDLCNDEQPATRIPRSCRCEGEPPAVQKQSGTSLNPGRLFWVCARPRGEQCGFFEWDDVPPRPRSAQSAGARNQPSPKRRRTANPAVFSLVAIDLVAGTVSSSVLTENGLDTLRAISGVKVDDVGIDVVGSRSLKITVELQAFASVKELFENHGTQVVCELPRNVFARLEEYLKKEESRKRTRIPVTRPLDEILPRSICEKLMEFQWEGVHFALQRDGRCLIGDDMGLGKTLQAIAVARIYRDDWPLLVVCPSSLRLNWKEEMLKWLGEDIDPEDINVVMKGSDCHKRMELINIVSYELVQKIPERYLARCNFVIADESHYLKSRDTKRTRFVTPLLSNARRALLLSGTPALSRPVELFPQISSLEPVLFSDYRGYAERYCNAHMGRWGWDVTGSSCLEELHMTLSGSCLIRRKKADVLTQLPAKQRGVVWVETKPSVMKMVTKAQREYEAAKYAADNATGADAVSCRNAMRGAMNKLYSLTGEAKLEAVLQFLKESLESTPKLLVFCHHQEVLVMIDEFVRLKTRTGTIVIDGKTPQGARQGLCKTFQTDSKCRVAVLSITAAGVGLTLTAASMVVFAELYWNPGSLLQAEDRAHRIGQKDSVLVQYLLARETLDESMWTTVRRKLVVVGKSLTGSAVPLSVDNDDRSGHGPMDKFVNESGEVIEMDDSKTERCVVIDGVEESPTSDHASARLENVMGRGAQASTERKVAKASSCEVIDLASDDETFPLEVCECGTPQRPSRLLYDADLAFAQKLRSRF